MDRAILVLFRSCLTFVIITGFFLLVLAFLYALFIAVYSLLASAQLDWRGFPAYIFFMYIYNCIVPLPRPLQHVIKLGTAHAQRFVALVMNINFSSITGGMSILPFTA